MGNSWWKGVGKHFFTRQLRAAAMLCTPSRREDIKSGHKTGLNLSSNRTGRINKGAVVTKEIFILFLCKKKKKKSADMIEPYKTWLILHRLGKKTSKTCKSRLSAGVSHSSFHTFFSFCL